MPARCSICKKIINKKNCYFRKNKKAELSSEKQEVSFLVEKNNTKSFVVDSGSTSHMVNNIKLFEEVTNIKKEISVAKKTQSMEAQGMGKIKIENCMLNNLLYVPDLSKNLISVNCITKNGGEVKFTKDKVEI